MDEQEAACWEGLKRDHDNKLMDEASEQPTHEPKMQLNPEPLKVVKVSRCIGCGKRAPWCSCGTANYVEVATVTPTDVVEEQPTHELLGEYLPYEPERTSAWCSIHDMHHKDCFELHHAHTSPTPGIGVREAIVLPCGHLADRPANMETDVECDAGCRWHVRFDRNTWNVSRIA